MDIDLFNGFYNGKKIFVTGHTGFKGAWLSLWLHNLGAEVIGYSTPPPTNPSLFDTLKIGLKATHNIGDIRDLQTLSGVMEQYKPDIVFHLAAQPLVRVSYSEPISTYETNVMGTVNILEAVRHSESVKAFVNITTDKCYENKEWSYAYRENDPLGGNDPYSSSKACSELITSAYRCSFFSDKPLTGVATARAGNVIGGGDWALDRIIPDCIRALSTTGKILVRNPNAIRPWQYVLEPLSGYLLLGMKLFNNKELFGEAWNFGPNPHGNIPVKDVVERVIQEWGNGTWEMPKLTSQPHESHFLKLDHTKAANDLGWHPVYSITEALAETVGWYKAYTCGQEDMNSYSLDCIGRYVEKARRTLCGK